MCHKNTITVLDEELQLFINKEVLQNLPLKDKKTIANFIFMCAKIKQKDMGKKPDHLLKLELEAKIEPYGTKKYWELRCRYLEKTIDETYSIAERNNCRELYVILTNKTP